MGWSCNLFGRVISVTTPRSVDGVAEGRSSKSKKKWKKGRRSHRGGPMEDEVEQGGYIDYRCSPHPALPPADSSGHMMARSVVYSNDSHVVVMQAPQAGYGPPALSSHAYASPAPVVVTAAPVVFEQQVPPTSKSRVRFALPGGGGHDEEPVLAMPVGPAPMVPDSYYKNPQHEYHQQVLQQVVRAHEVDPTVAGPPGWGTYHAPPPHTIPPTSAMPPGYGHYNYSYRTPGKEAIYRIGTDANRFSMFSDENPNACAIA